jgi:predicted RNA-binding protein YlxR (DUF448 family)
MNDRTCIVTRASGDADDLIRFVADPDGVIVPDLKRILPGRGCWVTPERSILQQAIKRGSFARALKKPVQASSELPDLVDRLLAGDLLGMMGLARKAGQFVGGATKVDKSVRSGEALAVFHTTDAADDGVRKIDQARKAVEMAFDLQVPSYRLFGIDAMEAALGEGALIHAAALAGQAGEGVVKRAKILHRYRNGPVGTRSGPD